MKRIMIALILVSSISCIFSSCAKLPVYQSKAMTSVDDEFLTQEAILKYYDVDNKLEYGFGNDNEYLYIRFETKDAITQMKMLNMGFKVFVDSTGKKKKRQYYQYPVSREGERGNRQSGERGERGERGQRPDKMDLKRLLMNVSQDVIALEDGDTRRFNNLENSEGFIFKLHAGEENLLIWEAAIPLEQIGDFDQEKGFVLGFVSGAMSSSMGGGNPGGRPSGGGMPGGGSGGSRPGGGGGSMGSGSGPGGGEMMQKMQQMQNPIDLWCTIIL